MLGHSGAPMFMNALKTLCVFLLPAPINPDLRRPLNKGIEQYTNMFPVVFLQEYWEYIPQLPAAGNEVPFSSRLSLNYARPTCRARCPSHPTLPLSPHATLVLLMYHSELFNIMLNASLDGKVSLFGGARWQCCREESVVRRGRSGQLRVYIDILSPPSTLLTQPHEGRHSSPRAWRHSPNSHPKARKTPRCSELPPHSPSYCTGNYVPIKILFPREKILCSHEALFFHLFRLSYRRYARTKKNNGVTEMKYTYRGNGKNKQGVAICDV